MTIDLASEPRFAGGVSGSNALSDAIRRGYYGFCPTETWTPNVNLYETDEQYLVCVDLAGVEKETIDLTVHEGRLRLRGNRAVPTRPSAAGMAEGVRRTPPRVRMHLMEIDHGAFSREVELPADVSQSRITASYHAGMLWVEIPKS